MMTKLLVLVIAVVVAVQRTLAAPQSSPRLLVAIDKPINGWLDKVPGTITPDHPLEIRINAPDIAEVYIQMTEVDITGVNDFDSSGSTAEFIAGKNSTISITIHSPKVTLNAGHYFMNGTMVDHIELVGAGPGMISVDDMVVMLKGYGSYSVDPLYVEFTEASIDLEMWRWTVDLEDAMPGTDLGTVLNEFLTMCGPEIFDTIENNLNSSGKLLNFLNSLFQTPA